MALWRSSTCIGNQPCASARGKGCAWVLGCGMVLPSPMTEGQCPAARWYGCASGVGSGDGCGGFFVFLFSSFYMLESGGGRKEKTTEQNPKNTAGQEAFLEMAHIGAVS